MCVWCLVSGVCVRVRVRVRAYLSQQHYPLAIRPDDVVHLRAHSLPGQLRSPQARLQEEEINNHLFLVIFFSRLPLLISVELSCYTCITAAQFIKSISKLQYVLVNSSKGRNQFIKEDMIFCSFSGSY